LAGTAVSKEKLRYSFGSTALRPIMGDTSD
jgi:hypothetical protein